MKKYRDRSGLFTVEGEKMVEEALKSSFKVERIYRSGEIGQEAMSRISALSSPSPVLAVVRKPEGLVLGDESRIESALVPSCRRDLKFTGKSVHSGDTACKGLFLILRVADWFGVDAVFASHGTVDLFNPKVVQATMGAVFRVRFHYVDIPRLASAVLSLGGKVYGTFLDGDNIYYSDLDTGTDRPVLVVTGNESEGISPEVAALVSGRLFIPPYPADDPGSESLNAAVATAVTLAEFRRRT